MLNRRDLIKMGLLGGGYMLLPHHGMFARAPSQFLDNPQSPPTTPWRSPLPRPDAAPHGPTLSPLPGYTDFYRNIGLLNPATKYCQLVADQRWASFHPDLPPTAFWGYRPADRPDWPFALGPTLVYQFGRDERPDIHGGIVVRHSNHLPVDHLGFGVTRGTAHHHGGHHPAESDGFPTNIEGFDPFVTEVGQHYDHFFPNVDPGFADYKIGRTTERAEITARPSTLWYHDHLIDFTGPNVYRGLAGFINAFDDIDSGNEHDESPGALRLPSGEFDVPIALQDKLFAADGSLVFSSFDHDGFIGDKFVANGAIQPYMIVKRRKYRFRLLNGANARIFQLFLSNATGKLFPMTQIATEGGLLAAPIPNLASVTISNAERVEVVVDFGDAIFDGQQAIFLENRLKQTEGRKPDGLVSRGDQIIKFIFSGPQRYEDYSVVPGQLRPFAPASAAEIQSATYRTFEFGRSHGAWTINDRLAGDLSRPRIRPTRGRPEIWRLVNNSGGWWHPIHIHSELFRVLRRNGRTPPLRERDGMAKKDTILLRDNDSVEVFIKFRDYLGPFVFHCHNLEHEDMAMMARFDVENDA